MPDRSVDPRQLGIGRATLVAAPRGHRDFAVHSLGPDVGRVLDALVAANGSLSVGAWSSSVATLPGLTIRGDARAPVLGYHHERERAVELIDRIERTPLRRAQALLTRLTGDAELGDQAWLQLAIVDEQLQLHEAAVGHVDKGARRLDAPRSSEGDAGLAELSYWRGRALLGLRRYGEAEHDLATAIARAPDHGRAYLYRAHAIRALIEADFEAQLEASVHHYIKLGAPLGIDETVRRLMKPRR